MNIELFRSYCLHKKAVEETFPFGDNTLVFKVMGKIFALAGLETGDEVNIKCDPSYAIELREEYSEIRPGFHMNKKHWNTVQITGSLPDDLLEKLIDHSYELVVASLSKRDRETLMDI